MDIKKWFKKAIALIGTSAIVGFMAQPMVAQTTSFYTDRAVATYPINNQGVLIPIPYGQVRICSFPSTGSPCTPVAPDITDINGNPLSVIGGGFGQITTDVVGRFSFGCSLGNSYQVQVASSASNTPQLNYPITCPGSGLNPTFGNVVVGGTLNNVFYTATRELGSTTCGVQEAINAAPSTGGKVIYNHVGQCTATSGVTINKPLILEGLCTVGTTTSTYSSFLSCSELKNGTTGSDLITITIPAGTFLSGIKIKDIALEGNQFVVGATAGSNIRVLGGSAATVIREVDFDNVISHDAFQAGFRISNNSFLINFFGGGAFNNVGDGVLIDATTGNPSQVYLYGFRSDLNTGCGVHASSAGGGNGGDLYVYGGTMSDSSSGICVDNGSTFAMHTFGVHFEHNSNDGIHYFGSSQHSSMGDVFFANTTNDYNLSCAGQGFGSEFIIARNPTFLGTTPTNWRVAASCNNPILDHPTPNSPVIVDAGSFQPAYILNSTHRFGLGSFTVVGTPYSTGGIATIALNDTTAAQATPNKSIAAKSGQLQFNSSAGTQIVAMDDTGDLWPSIVNTSTLGLGVLPWKSIFIGAAGTNNINVTGTSTAARTQTLLDATGTIPVIVAKFDATAQAANIGSTLLYAVPASGAGLYQASCSIIVTQAATTSSTLPACEVIWTDNDTGGSEPTTSFSSTNSANTVGTAQSGAGALGGGLINAKASTNINFTTLGYASVGATVMQFAVHVKLKYLGN